MGDPPYRPRESSTKLSPPLDHKLGEDQRRRRFDRHGNETFTSLSPAASINYMLKHVKADEEIVPSGWEEFVQYCEEGTTGWEAAGLPMKLGNAAPELYPDVKEYWEEPDTIAWAIYYQHLKDKQTQYRWSVLQMGVMLGYMVKGPIKIML